MDGRRVYLSRFRAASLTGADDQLEYHISRWQNGLTKVWVLLTLLGCQSLLVVVSQQLVEEVDSFVGDESLVLYPVSNFTSKFG